MDSATPADFTSRMRLVGITLQFKPSSAKPKSARKYVLRSWAYSLTEIPR